MGRPGGAIIILSLVGVLSGGLSDIVPPAPDEETVATVEAVKVRRKLPRPLTESWTYERQEDDTPIARSCAGGAGNRVCVAVACRSDAGLTFEYFGPGKPSSEALAQGSVFVSTLDGVRKVDITWSLLNRPFTRRAPLDAGLAELLTLGGRGLYEDEERKLPFTLVGSAAAIEAVRLRCR